MKLASILVAMIVAALPGMAVGDSAPRLPPDDVLKVRLVEGTAPPVTVDGRLVEPIWAEIAPFDDFVVIEPDTLARGEHATLVRLLYTDRGLYVGAQMEQPPDTLIARLSGRDGFDLNRDSINLTIDASGEGRYGYWFGVNLGDALMDGTALPERRFSNEWDGPWWGRSAVTDTGWSAEMFIPWSIIAMPAGSDVRRMGVYMSRKVAYLDERWGWPALPPTRSKFMSELHPMELKGVAPRQQYNVYPFSSVTVDRYDDEVRYKAGADVFWRPSSNFQLNATINPDFGSVESDDVIINLSATETFFPEKRLFFVEGQDVFVASPRADTRSRGVGQTGAPYTMVNTRRIGGAPREPEENARVTIPERELSLPVELAGAVKATGQIGPLRYGVLTAFEKDTKFRAEGEGVGPVHIPQPGSDYGIARLLYEDHAGGAYRGLGVLSTAVLNDQADAYANGVDAHYLTEDGRIQLDGQMFMSDITGVDTGYGGFADLVYTLRQGVRQSVGVEWLDENVDINDLGFLGRNDVRRIRSSHTRVSSDIGWARDNEFDVRGFVQESTDGLFTGAGVFLSNRTTFHDLTSLTGRLGFRPASYDDINSFDNGAFRVERQWDASVEYNTDPTRRLQFEVKAGFFDEDLGGDTFSYAGKVVWQPADGVSVTAGATYTDRHGWLVYQDDDNYFTTFDAEQWEPRISFEYFFTARQQLRLSVQWVGIKAHEDEFFLISDSPDDLIEVSAPPGSPGSDSFTISDGVFQLRYRWEIAPLSDLFVVYTRVADTTGPLADNGFPDLLERAWDQPVGDQLVVKLRYRFGS